MPMKMDSCVLHTNVTLSVETQTIRIAELQQNHHTRFGGGPTLVWRQTCVKKTCDTVMM